MTISIADLKIYGQMSELSQQGMDLKQRDVERKSALVKNNFGSQLDLDNASTALVTAQRPVPVAAAEDRDRQGATARQSRSAARANSRPMPRPRPRSTRPSAISTTP